MRGKINSSATEDWTGGNSGGSSIWQRSRRT